MPVRVIDNITKVFPDMIEVKIFNKPIFYYANDNPSVKRSRSSVGDDYEPTITSLSRTKSLVRDIVRSNSFELFCTFTFDPKKINRFSYASCFSAMSCWLHHQKDRATAHNKRFEYIVVPEKHKDGAWHFHALIKGYCGSKRDSHHFTSSGRRVYNLTSYRSGFTTAVEIDDSNAVVNYITKYISKDFIKEFNQRRFTCSRGLLRPIKEVNSPRFRKSLPLSRVQIYDNGDVSLYHILPDF